jgi:hypothetical protein
LKSHAISYARLRTQGTFSEELLEKILRGVSAQKYAETVISWAKAFGVSPTAVSRKRVGLTAQKSYRSSKSGPWERSRRSRSFWTRSTGVARPSSSRWVWT